MISKNEYYVLGIILKSHKIDEKKYKDILFSLIRNGLINSYNTKADKYGHSYDTVYEVSIEGERAIEEYERTTEYTRRNKQAIIISIIALALSAAAIAVSVFLHFFNS